MNRPTGRKEELRRSPSSTSRLEQWIHEQCHLVVAELGLPELTLNSPTSPAGFARRKKSRRALDGERSSDQSPTATAPVGTSDPKGKGRETQGATEQGTV